MLSWNLTISDPPQELRIIFKFTRLNCFPKWLPIKILSSNDFLEKDLMVSKKLLLMISIVVHALETMNQLENGFGTQDVRFGFIATVSFIDNGRWN